YDEPFRKLLNQGMIQGSSRFVYRVDTLGYNEDNLILKNLQLPEIFVSLTEKEKIHQLNSYEKDMYFKGVYIKLISTHIKSIRKEIEKLRRLSGLQGLILKDFGKENKEYKKFLKPHFGDSFNIPIYIDYINDFKK